MQLQNECLEDRRERVLLLLFREFAGPNALGDGSECDQDEAGGADEMEGGVAFMMSAVIEVRLSVLDWIVTGEFETPCQQTHGKW